MGNQLAREQEQLKNLNCKYHAYFFLIFVYWLSNSDRFQYSDPNWPPLFSLVSEKELQKLYKNFSKIDKDKSGTLEPEEFFDIPGKSAIWLNIYLLIRFHYIRACKQPSGQKSYRCTG